MKRFILSTMLILAMVIQPVVAVENTSLLDDVVAVSVQVNALLDKEISDDQIVAMRNNMEAQAKYQAQQKNVSVEEVYQLYLNELYAQIPETSMASESGKKQSPLPAAVTGYIFFTDTGTFYNHCGIYTNATTFVEALTDPGVWSKSIYDEDAYQTTVIENNDSAVLSVLGASATTRSAAATWATSKVGRSYDWDFLDNKTDGILVEGFWISEDTSYNCSELVWKSYMSASNNTIDLDNDGSLGVYPNDINESPLTTFYVSFG